MNDSKSIDYKSALEILTVHNRNCIYFRMRFPDVVSYHDAVKKFFSVNRLRAYVVDNRAFIRSATLFEFQDRIYTPIQIDTIFESFESLSFPF